MTKARLMVATLATFAISAISATGAQAACLFNIDQSSAGSSTRATSDGLIFIRYALSFPNVPASVANATENAALSPAQISAFIDTHKAVLDVDGDTEFTAFDAQVIARHLLGFRSPTLTDGIAFTASAKRRTDRAVQRFIDDGCIDLNAAPAVVIHSPRAGDTYSASGDAPLRIATNDTDGSIVQMQARVDGGVWYTVPAPFETVLGSPHIGAWTRSLGAHLLEVKATDDGGASTTVAVPFNLGNAFGSGIFRLDMFDNALLGATIPLRTYGLIGGAGGTPPSSVAYYVNGALIGSVAQGSPYIFLWKPAATGTYEVSLRATDSSGTIYFGDTTTITIRDAPLLTDLTAQSPLIGSFSGVLRAPSGSVILVNGQQATFDPVSGRFFINGLAFVAGANTVNLEIMTPDGQRFTQSATVMGASTASKFLVKLDPDTGLAPFESRFSISRQILSGVPSNFYQLRVTCDFDSNAPTNIVYDSSAIANFDSFAGCQQLTPGARLIVFEFLNAQGGVIETHRRRVLARAPASEVTNALTTYFSFLSLLADNKVNSAANVGFVDVYRDQWKALLLTLSVSEMNIYAEKMFNVREVSVSGGLAQVVVALPEAVTGALKPHVIRMIVDSDGIWRIESL